MNHPHPTPNPAAPVVIGASIGGMIISDALSRAGVPHTLVGDPPGPGLRVGESLDLAASVALPALFPHLRRFFHHKGGVIGVFGSQRVDLVFEMPEYRALRALVRLMGFELPPALLQVDRIGFDAALYAERVRDPLCTHVPGRVVNIEHDPQTDRIRSLRLADGRELQPRFVFDGSGPARVVGRAAGLKLETSSAPHRAAVAHFARPPGCKSWWTPHTTLLRLYESIHGIAGGVWCIPMNEVVSIGVSADASTRDSIGDDELLARGVEALRRAGLEHEFGSPLRQLGARYQYAGFERSVGANYMLVGSAALSAWWLSSTGLAMILAAAAIAPELAHGQRQLLPRYTAFTNQVCGVHGLFERLMNDEAVPRTGADLRPIYEPLMRGNLIRLAMYCHLARRRTSAEVVAPVVRDLVGRWQLGDVLGIEQSIELAPPRPSRFERDLRQAPAA